MNQYSETISWHIDFLLKKKRKFLLQLLKMYLQKLYMTCMESNQQIVNYHFVHDLCSLHMSPGKPMED